MEEYSYNRTIFVGDVHGCLEELKTLLEKCGYDNAKDRLVVLGDLVDRGPDSNGSIEYVRSLGAECVVGNHDDRYIRFYRHEHKKLESLKRGDVHPYKNPMRLGSPKLEVFRSISQQNIEWLCSLPSSIYIPELNILAVHAGVLPDRHPLDEQPHGLLFHCRYVDEVTKKPVNLGPDHRQPEGSVFWAEYYTHDINIVHGHHVHNLETPVTYSNHTGAKVIDVDTGCCFGGRLTAYVVPTSGGESAFVQVNALEVYRSY